MKTFCLATGFVFISVIALAQVSAPYKKNLIQLNPVSKLSSTIAPQKAKLINLSPLGKVFALPVDNMPCLVPVTATAALMPVQNIPPVGAVIPNAFPVQDVFAAVPENNTLKPGGKIELNPSKNLMLDLIRKNKPKDYINK